MLSISWILPAEEVLPVCGGDDMEDGEEGLPGLPKWTSTKKKVSHINMLLYPFGLHVCW